MSSDFLWSVVAAVIQPCRILGDLEQGGAVAAAFAASFPHLIDESVVFLASAGIMEVNDVYIFPVH